MATNNAINTDTNSFCETANNLSDVATPATARLNLYIPLAVNTATVLSATDYGKEVVCTGASSYALTLPTVSSNANKFIDIFCQTTSNALVTVTPASGTISGQSTVVLGTGDGIRIQNDGTNWWILNHWLQPVSFLATLSANQSIPTGGGGTTIAWDGTTFNVGGFFNTGTGVFTPLLPGKYHIEQVIIFATSATGHGERNYILKTGANASVVSNSLASTFAASMTNTVLVSLNGSTDNVSGLAFQTTGGNLDLLSTTNGPSIMSGFRASLF